ncbi:MAG: flavodoxin family protein [Promethearchaeia archaeon]|nr:MAG: flavodoxin family protein [Candidatus Lokiarchaeia archaeon]
MDKQVIAILGGKREGNTHNLLKYIEKRLNENSIKMEIIHLNELDIKDCRGCENCVLGDGCPIKDDMPKITEKIQNSDGIIIASPVYNNNVSGKMKMFIDKTVKWAHSPILTGKPYLGVTTTSSSGLNIVLKYLTIVGVNWGAHSIGNIWASKRNSHMKKNNAIIDRFIYYIYLDPKFHRPTLNQIIQFQVKKVLAKTVFPNDFPYWQGMNWLNKIYYYECRINLFYRLFGAFFNWMFFKIMKSAVNKYKDQIGTKNYGKLNYE